MSKCTKMQNVATFYSRLLVGETCLKIAAALTVVVEADLSSVGKESGNLCRTVQSKYKGFSPILSVLKKVSCSPIARNKCWQCTFHFNFLILTALGLHSGWV